jgi:Cu/Ag efflux protein CusF
MKRILSLLTAGLLSLSFSAYALEEGEQADEPGAVAGRLVEVTATIEAIDYENRTVTLKGPERTVTLKVDERARNFEQAKVGDTVTVEYFESVALMLESAGGETPPPAEFAAVERAPLGEKPGISAIDTRDITASVEAIDHDARTVTLKGPEGNTLTLEVGDNAPNFDKVKVGDQVRARYTQALAISVKTPEGE